MFFEATLLSGKKILLNPTLCAFKETEDAEVGMMIFFGEHIFEVKEKLNDLKYSIAQVFGRMESQALPRIK
jgi:hypothetical protein